jgi:hypothetical protein
VQGVYHFLDFLRVSDLLSVLDFFGAHNFFGTPPVLRFFAGLADDSGGVFDFAEILGHVGVVASDSGSASDDVGSVVFDSALELDGTGDGSDCKTSASKYAIISIRKFRKE